MKPIRSLGVYLNPFQKCEAARKAKAARARGEGNETARRVAREHLDGWPDGGYTHQRYFPAPKHPAACEYCGVPYCARSSHKGTGD